MATVRLISHKHFLTAADHVVVPVVKLSPSLLPSKLRDRGVILQAILGFCTPSHNIKFIPASYMLESALTSGHEEPLGVLIENSSGNFALSLATCARWRGLRVTALVPNDISQGKLLPLQAAGVRVLKEREAIGILGLSESCGGVEMARLLAEKNGWINLGQYSDSANPESYAKLLAPQIVTATKGKLAIFAAALGSTGTLIGLGGYLKAQIPGLQTLAVIPHTGEDIPGCRDDRRLREVRFNWRPYADLKSYVSARDAFHASLELWESGIFAGPSSGAVLFALRELLLTTDKKGKLDDYRSEDGSVVAMFSCADTLYPYFDQAKKHCPERFADAYRSTVDPIPSRMPDPISLVPSESL